MDDGGIQSPPPSKNIKFARPSSSTPENRIGISRKQFLEGSVHNKVKPDKNLFFDMKGRGKVKQ